MELVLQIVLKMVEYLVAMEAELGVEVVPLLLFLVYH